MYRSVKTTMRPLRLPAWPVQNGEEMMTAHVLFSTTSTHCAVRCPPCLSSLSTFDCGAWRSKYSTEALPTVPVYLRSSEAHVGGCGEGSQQGYPALISGFCYYVVHADRRLSSGFPSLARSLLHLPDFAASIVLYPLVSGFWFWSSCGRKCLSLKRIACRNMPYGAAVVQKTPSTQIAS